MKSATDVVAPPTKEKRRLRGALLWGVAFGLYLIPGFVVAFRMAADLGPKLKDAAAVARLIRPAVRELYATDVLLRAAFIFLLAGMLYLIARGVLRRGRKA